MGHSKSNMGVKLKYLAGQRPCCRYGNSLINRQSDNRFNQVLISIF
jgi:hypothetical protein